MTEIKDISLSKWLVASDIDGTLNNKFRKLPKRNYVAIEHFIKDCGGNFTLASGRSVDSMRKHYKNLNLTTPAVILNGAGVYDFQKEEMLFYSEITQSGRDIVRQVYEKFKSIEILIVANDVNYILQGRIFAPAMANHDPLKDYKFKRFDDVPKEKWGKVIFLGLPIVIKKLRDFLSEIDTSSVNFMSSSVFSFEMLNANTHKGTGVMKVAEIIGVDKDHTAAIGDYFNDYDMLKSVAHPACCGQAPKGMKEISELVTCHCNQGAVADLIEYIEHKYKEE